MTALDFSQPARPSRAARRPSSGGGGGGGIGLVIPMVVTLVAAVVLIAGGMIVAGKVKPAAEAVMDEAGLGAAVALAVIEPEWWDVDHGVSQPSFYEQLVAAKDAKIKKVKDDPNESSQEPLALEQDFKAFLERFGIEKEGGALRTERDAKIRSSNRERLERLSKIAGSNVVSATVFDKNGREVLAGVRHKGYKPGRSFKIGQIEGTRVLFSDTGTEGRLYKVPITDMFNSPAGHVEVLVSAGAVAEAGNPTSLALIIALVGTLLVGLVAFLLCMGPSKAVRQLASDLEAVARGDTSVRITPRGGGEPAAAARAADRAIKTVFSMAEQAAAAAAAVPAEATASVDTSALLPQEPPRADGYEIEFVHKPSSEGGNDYFDFIHVDDKHLGVVIADMPHAGANGAFIASTFRALMRVCGEGEVSPAAVLGRVNRVMANELKRGDHITAMYTVLDIPNGILSVASAGHLPLIFWKLSKRGSALLNPEGIAIGLDKGPVFEKTVVDKRIKLEKGDRYVLHTDGPVAAKNINGEEYGEERFYYLVNREAPKNSAAFVNFVANEVDLFHEGAAQLDDITIVTVRKLDD